MKQKVNFIFHWFNHIKNPELGEVVVRNPIQTIRYSIEELNNQQLLSLRMCLIYRKQNLLLSDRVNSQNQNRPN